VKKPQEVSHDLIVFDNEKARVVCCQNADERSLDTPRFYGE
jgi:hypothetical protein